MPSVCNEPVTGSQALGWNRERRSDFDSSPSSDGGQ